MIVSTHFGLRPRVDLVRLLNFRTGARSAIDKLLDLATGAERRCAQMRMSLIMRMIIIQDLRQKKRDICPFSIPQLFNHL